MKRTTFLLTAVVALAGCTASTTVGKPTPAAGTSTRTSSDSSSGLDISGYTTRPCDILKPEQVATLGAVKAGVAGTGVLGPMCTWNGQDPMRNSGYDVTATTGRDFEAQVAGVKDRSVFVDRKIDGVRVVSTDGTDGTKYCLTSIQFSATDSVTVQIAGAANERATKKPCPETERVAQLILTNLRG